MIGIILVGIGSFLREASLSIGKWEIKSQKESLPIFGFLTLFWSVVFFVNNRNC